MSQTLRAFQCRRCDCCWYSRCFLKQPYLCPECGEPMIRLSELYTLVAEDQVIVENKPKNPVTTVRLDKQVHDILKQQAKERGVTLQSHVKQMVLRQQ